MRISPSMSKAMVLDQKMAVCPLQVVGVLWFLFTSKGGIEQEIDRWISGSNANNVPVCRGVEGAELEGKALDLPVDLHSYSHLWS